MKKATKMATFSVERRGTSWMVTSPDLLGLFVVGRSLGEALSKVAGGIDELWAVMENDVKSGKPISWEVSARGSTGDLANAEVVAINNDDEAFEQVDGRVASRAEGTLAEVVGRPDGPD